MPSCSEVFSVLQGLVGNYRSAVKRLDTEVERAEEDVDVVRDDLSRLIDEVPGSSSEQNDQRMLELLWKSQRNISNSPVFPRCNRWREGLKERHKCKG